MSEHKMGHVQDFRIYLNVLLGLMGLTVATVLVSLVDFGIFNTLVALFVACIKASLVILFFMHGKYESKVTWAFVWYPIFLLATLVGALFLDYGFRAPDSRAVIPASYDVQHPGGHGEASHDGAADHTDAADHSAPAGHGEDSHEEEPEVHAEDDVESSASASDHGVPAAESSSEAAAPTEADPWASVNGDVAAGRAKAEMLCASCHIVEGKGTVLAGAPPFEETANDPTKTPELLRKWIKDPQSVKPGSLMPPLGLSDADIENVLAYLHTYQH